MPLKSIGTLANRPANPLPGDEYTATDTHEKFACFVTGTWVQSTQIKTGTYTGDGATSLGITGVGFTPLFLRIWDRQTVDGTAMEPYETSKDMIDDIGAGAAYDVKNAQIKDNKIISLDADGFTVDDDGADAHPNKSGQVYNYWALG